MPTLTANGFIPRKLSIEDAANDYDLHLIAMNIQIFIEGRRLKGVTAYNLDEGWLECYNGQVRNDKAVIVRLYSNRIEVKWKEDK